MNIPNFFFNRAGRLRSGWRFAAFAVIFLILMLLLLGLLRLTLAGLPLRTLETGWGFLIQGALLFAAAAAAGWVCSRALEDLPWRSLGWSLHGGWWRDLGMGALTGGLSLALAAATIAAFGGYDFGVTPTELLPAAARTLFNAALIFLVGAAAEEMLFRGYPLQTLLRSWPGWLAVVPASLLFAAVHLRNPHVSGFTFLNTALAGVWLGAAYVRTRSLWLPLGLHWGWNWTMGALLGLPVSGITEIAPTPLLRADDEGPAWLTGGGYGVEGGAVCTLALLLSTLFIWRAPFFSPDPEMKGMTDAEHPAGSRKPISIRG